MTAEFDVGRPVGAQAGPVGCDVGGRGQQWVNTRYTVLETAGCCGLLSNFTEETNDDQDRRLR